MVIRPLSSTQFLISIIALMLTLPTKAVASPELKDTQSYSYSSQLPLPSEALNKIENADSEYLFKGRLFGFNSTQSCVYKFESLLIVRNYCSSSSKFPAKSFYVMSPQIGLHYFYEENIGNFKKQEITLLNTPELVQHLWPGLENLNLSNLNEMLEKLYYSHDEACWMTGYSDSETEASGGCLIEDLQHYPDWQKDSAAIVTGTRAWQEALRTLSLATESTNP